MVFGLKGINTIDAFGTARQNIAVQLFPVGNHMVTLFDIIISVVCLLALVLFAVFVIKDIKRQKQEGEIEKAETEATTDKEVTPSQAKETKEEKKKRLRAEKANKKKEKIAPPVDPLVTILGFDPYAPVDNETCEIAETFYDAEQETEDMRILRERMQVARIAENKLSVLNDRLTKVKYELEKISRLLRDNKVVISTATTVSDRLREEITALSVDKRTARKNKASLERVREELAKNEELTGGLIGLVDTKTNEEKLLRDAQNYLTAEISRTERDLSFINSDIDRLNESVGAELKKIENDNRARVLMTKYRELKPLLETVNTLFSEIKTIDEKLAAIHEEKRRLKTRLNTLMEELRRSYGAMETGDIAGKISEVNRNIVKADEDEERLIKEKEEKIAAFRIAKNKTNEFLEKEKYDTEDIIIAEDKVVAEIEYERVKREYEQTRVRCEAEYAEAQRVYDAIANRKVRFGKRQEAQKRAYEEELGNALANLKKARAASEKAISDCETVIPSLSPASLIQSGSGVMSKERVSKRTEAGRDKLGETRERLRKIRQESAEREGNIRSSRYPVQQRKPAPATTAPVPRRNAPDRLTALLARLNELEKIARREQEKRARMLTHHQSLSPEERIEKRKAEVVALRKNLLYIDSVAAANEFKRKLYRYSLSLAEDEMSDTVLSEMIHRTMEEAAALGQKGTEN